MTDTNKVPISIAFEEMHKLLTQRDWHSAGIIAKHIRNRAIEEDLFISDDEKSLLASAMAYQDAHRGNEFKQELVDREPNYDGYPDDSDRDPETGSPYGDLT